MIGGVDVDENELSTAVSVGEDLTVIEEDPTADIVSRLTEILQVNIEHGQSSAQLLTALHNDLSAINITSAESAELLKQCVEQGEMFAEIQTELVTLNENTAVMQMQLTETYKLLAYIFILLIFYGIGKLFSGLLNTT